MIMFIISIRGLFTLSHKKDALRFENPDDCMALNPIANYFNHTDGEGCTVDLVSLIVTQF